MLWEASLTTRTFKSLPPRRHKHAYSSSSSFVFNHELATTSTHASEDMELGSGELGTCFAVVTEGIQSHKTMPRIGADLSPMPIKGDQVLSDLLSWAINVEHLTVQAIAESCPSVPLPNWLDNTLTTLPPSHPVRRLIPPLDRPIVRDLIGQNPDVSDAGVVFAFQAPLCEGLPLDHAGNDGHSGARVIEAVPKPSILNSDLQTGISDFHGNPFEVTHNGSVEFRENFNTLAVLRTVPFSTPGPVCAVSRAPAARCPWGSNTTLSHATDNGSQEAMDVPLPFSTPGPFASPRPVSGHVFGNHAVAPPHILPDEVYTTIQKSSAIPTLSSHTTKFDRTDTSLFSVQDGCGQLSALPNLLPAFTSNNLGLSSSPTLVTEPTFLGDRGLNTPSPGLSWLSPVELTRRSGGNGNTAHDGVFTAISHDSLGQKTPFDAFSLSKFPISPKHGAESLFGLRRHMTASETFPRTPVAPPPSIPPGSLASSFDWVSPDAQSPGSSDSIDRFDIVDVNAYTPAIVVSEPVRKTSGIFAPTPGVFLSPLLDTPDSRGHAERHDQWERDDDWMQ